MPTIKQFDPTIPALRPSETGIEATVQTARRAGAFYNQVGAAQERVGDEEARMFGSDVKATGDLAVDYAQHQEISHGAAAYAGLNDKLTQLWNDTVKNADPNDPTVADKFRQGVLEPNLEKFGESFLTEGGQKWAEARVDALRNHMFEKTASDMSSLAKDAVAVNMRQTANSLSNTAMNDPSAVPHLLDSSDGLVGGVVSSSPNIKGADSAKARMELSQKMKESIVKAGAVGAIMKSPDPEGEAARWGAKYPEYISGEELKMLSSNARQQIRADRIDKAYSDKLSKDYDQDLSDKKITNYYYPKIYSDDPQVRASVKTKDIVNDDSLTRQDKRYMISVVERELKPETEARISAQTSAQIFRMTRDPNMDPQKVRAAIFDARAKDPGEAGSITQSDFKSAMQNLDDVKTPEGQERSHERDDFLKRFAPTIDPSMGDAQSLQFGHHTALGLQKMYETEKALQAKEKELGTNWRSLYDPSSPNYFGKAENIMKYRATMQQANDYQAALTSKNLTGKDKEILGITVENAPNFKPPPNWQYSASRKQYRDPSGQIYDLNGKPVK